MKNYREFMSRGECLFNAILSCLVPLILFLYIFLVWESVPSSGWGLIAVLMLLELGGCAFHWYRYFAYDKK